MRVLARLLVAVVLGLSIACTGAAEVPGGFVPDGGSNVGKGDWVPAGGQQDGGASPQVDGSVVVSGQVCGSQLTFNDPTFDACINLNCCSSLTPCLGEAACQACLSNPSGSSCSTDTLYQMFNSCKNSHCSKVIGPQCGNGACEAGETPTSCPADCGTTTNPVCGNGTCEAGETEANCPADCSTTNHVCGNGTCDAGETAANCPADCGTTNHVCGNGTCEAGETATNCPADCGSGGGVCRSGLTTGNATLDACLTQNCCPEFFACAVDFECPDCYDPLTTTSECNYNAAVSALDYCWNDSCT